jgi:hypothetical protein
MSKKQTEFHNMASDLVESSKPIKIGVIIILSFVGLYVVGHGFKIIGHAVRGYKEMTSAIKQ